MRASWLGWGKKAEALPAFVDTLLPSEAGDVLELDELWSFVGGKARTLWLWVALCRRTRQIVAWSLGDRSEQGASDLRVTLPEDYRCCATRSDLWRADRAAFPASTHRCCAKRDQERREPSGCHPLLHRHSQPAYQAINTRLNTTKDRNPSVWLTVSYKSVGWTLGHRECRTPYARQRRSLEIKDRTAPRYPVRWVSER